MIFSGCYTFPSYSSALKDVLRINQKLLNGLGIARDVGDSCGGILAGILSNYLPSWALLCISASVGFLGYGLEWLVVSHTIKPLPYWVIFIAAMASGSAICWINVAVFNASVRNFTRNRGPVAGLFKAYMGLSAAVYVTFCDTLFSNSAFSYLLMLVIVPSTFCLVSAMLFQPVSSAETQEEVQAERTSLHVFNTIACGLAVYIAVLALLPATKFQEIFIYKVMVIMLLIAFVGSPALVPVVLLSKVKGTKALDINKNEEKSHEALEDIIVDDKKIIGPQYHQKTRCRARLRSNGAVARCLLHLFGALRSLGMTNQHSLLKTWHFYVFLGNFSGRLASGNVSEYFLRARGMPRPAWMGLTKVPMILLFYWLSTIASLYVGSPVLGFCHGSLVTLTIPIVSEFYGLKHFGTNFTLANTCIVTRSYAFSSLAGYLYDKEVEVGEESSSSTCDGAECYGTTFRIVACCLTIALACDAILTLFSRALYEKLKTINTTFMTNPTNSDN
ncbi:hypothetical protein GOP47_0029904 [Adiantum capillus-veneris]|nr:hypothetical protein GOP47_0029904 [Adiantum capillus-veneris]